MWTGIVAPHQAILTSIGMIHSGGKITSALLTCDEPVTRFKRYVKSRHIIDAVEVRKKPAVDEKETAPRIAGDATGEQSSKVAKKKVTRTPAAKKLGNTPNAPKSTQAGGPKKPRKQSAGGKRRKGAAKTSSAPNSKTAAPAKIG